tara:strand:+ start:602 stop:874 length:273 start_codon:yes stop_codon:yes gene_type:complete
MNNEIVKDGNDFEVKREKKKRKMSDEQYEKAKEIVIENIINMQTKDLAGELEWLLDVCYFGSSGTWAYNRWNMVEDWNIDIEDVMEKEEE